MMVGAPLCLMAPFPLTEFLCPLRRHRPLGAPLPPLTRSPSPCKQGEASFGERGPPPPASGGEARFWVNHPFPPCFSCPPPLRGVGGERSETEGGIHVFLAHPHLGGGWRAERDGRGPPSFSCPPPLRGWVASGARRKGESRSRFPAALSSHL